MLKHNEPAPNVGDDDASPVAPADALKRVVRRSLDGPPAPAAPGEGPAPAADRANPASARPSKRDDRRGVSRARPPLLSATLPPPPVTRELTAGGVLSSADPGKTARDLLQEFRASGRQEPFEEIVRRYAGMVFNVCLRVTKNTHDAEDATQAVFLALAVQGRAEREIKYLGPWLQQVAHRLSLDIKRSKKRRQRREEIAGEVQQANDTADDVCPAGSADTQELKRLLTAELNQLPAKYRMPLVLHYFGGMSREEMARELNCKPSTLGVRIFRGRELLGKRLASRGVVVGGGVLAVMLAHTIRATIEDALIASTTSAAAQIAAGHGVSTSFAPAHVVAAAHGAGNAMLVAKIKAIAAALILAGAAVAGGQQVRDTVQSLNLDWQWNWRLPVPQDLGPSIRNWFRSLVNPPQYTRADDGSASDDATNGGAYEHPRLSQSGHADRTAAHQFAGHARGDGFVDAEQAAIGRAALDESVAPPPGDAAGAPDVRAPAVPDPAAARQPTRLAVTSGSGDSSPGAAPLPAREAPAAVALSGAPSRTFGARAGDRDVYTLTSGALHSTNLTVGDAGTAEFLQRGGSNHVDGDLVLGFGAGSRGTYRLDGGDLHADREFVGHEGGGSFVHTAGVNNVGGTLFVGYKGSGEYILSDDGKLNAGGVAVGVFGSGSFQQSGGSNVVRSHAPGGPGAPRNLGAIPGSLNPTIAVDSPVAGAGGGTDATGNAGQTSGGSVIVPPSATGEGRLAVAYAGKSRGWYTLTSGQLIADLQVVGFDGSGTFTQTGGENTAVSLNLGATRDGVGVYSLGGGELRLRTSGVGTTPPRIEIGGAGRGYFKLGDSHASGTVREASTTAGSLTVRGSRAGRGTLRGWGHVALTGTLENNGRIVADGYGQDRPLNLSYFGAVTNTISNPRDGGSNGWFAQRGGRLILPPLSLAEGDVAYNWGERGDDPTLDLVNSVHLAFDDVTERGDVSVQLLALDRAEIPALPNGHTFIGVWSFEPDETVSFDDVTLSVRYDDTLARELHLNEQVLKIWKYEPGRGWIHIHDDTFVRNIDQHTLTAAAGNDLTFFAVSAPEPTTLGALALGGWMLLRRRRQRRA